MTIKEVKEKRMPDLDDDFAAEAGGFDTLDELRSDIESTLRKAFDRMRQQGREELLRDDIAMRKAVDLMVEEAKPIPVEQAKARDKLWTPEKEKEKSGSEQIWTPGS